MLFLNRFQAGKTLATHLKHYAGRTDLIVLALPRGGVPVAFEIARALKAPLDAFIVRKLGTPGEEELAMGAIAAGGIRVINESIVRSLNIPDWAIEEVSAKERVELERRELLYRPTNTPINLKGRTAILVDDGLATGATMRAAILAVKSQGPAKVVVAVPVADIEVFQELAKEVDELVCAATPHPLLGVGRWYEDFSQTSDEEVRRLLALASRDAA
jgi:putative phosphoribosyl transferase